MNTTAQDQSVARRRSKGTAAVLVQFLGSMNLAITLLVVVCIASVIGTVLQQNQPYPDYLLKFGPYWFQVFEQLGLYDVYSAGWYLFILAFLVVSTSVCLTRNSPGMLREMNKFREHQQERSLRAFSNRREWTSALQMAEVEQLAARTFQRHGYRYRGKNHGEARLLAGMAGRSNRLGYIFTHLSIVVICVGGLIDGNLLLKFREWTGDLVVETRNIPVSQIDTSSRLPVTRAAFRGNVNIPEGRSAGVVFLNLKDGYVVQDLPFRLHVEEFRVEHYDTGEPSSFESDVVLTAPELDEPIHQTIRVNHPLIYDGYAIYQASFGDGGSQLALTAWPLTGEDRRPFELDGEVLQSQPLEINGREYQLELEDFQPMNVRPIPEAVTRRDVRNVGPSFTYRLRSPTGEAREYENYMLPVEVEGRQFFLSGVRGSPADDFRYLHLPADERGRPDTFMRFYTLLSNPDELRAASERGAQQTMSDFGLEDSQLVPQVAQTARELVRRLMEEDFPSVMAYLEASMDERQVPSERREVLMTFSRLTLERTLWEAYQEARDGTDVRTVSDLDEQGQQFFRDALAALSAMDQYAAPVFLQLRDFQHRQSTGLMIARAPGQNIVYLGFALLTIGIFLMFYVSHRRAWCWMRPLAGGGCQVLVAGANTRDPIGFQRRFQAMTDELDARLKAAEESARRKQD
ncbi:MAG: cytochrome c biogenesis protein ResB [Ectothiorhodospiraceae bacterium]|nr:cytochrome c biogenesis protein ResB [Ectothiorhodospiraceae bacterium]